MCAFQFHQARGLGTSLYFVFARILLKLLPCPRTENREPPFPLWHIFPAQDPENKRPPDIFRFKFLVFRQIAMKFP
jgi:hypothetical protein